MSTGGARGGDARERARRDVIDAVVELGYPEEFGEVLAGELGGEWSLRRMSGYLRQVGTATPAQVADEMLAIVAQRESLVERKVSERAQAAMTAFYNR